MNQPCHFCGNPAKVKLTKLNKKQVEEMWLCEQCAEAQSPQHKKVTSMSLEAVLAGILKGANEDEAAARPGAVPESVCPNCGLPYASYKATLLLGCSDCYAAFDTLLQSDLRKFHGTTTHRGRVPSGEPVRVAAVRDRADLKRRLDDAVRAEDFELAARLRDEIARHDAEAPAAPSTAGSGES